MISPRDPTTPLAVPVNTETGQPLTPYQLQHLEALREAAADLYAVMHIADGSAPPGEHQEHTWSGRRMSIAATHIETGLMFARKAALELKR